MPLQVQCHRAHAHLVRSRDEGLFRDSCRCTTIEVGGRAYARLVRVRVGVRIRVGVGVRVRVRVSKMQSPKNPGSVVALVPGQFQ